MSGSILYRPSGSGAPFPAVVLLPTCGGVGNHLVLWAQRLTDAGYVALIVDSNTPRKIRDNCQGAESLVSIDQVAADAASALAHLRALPFVRPDRLAVMGFSFGAAVALRLTSGSYQQRLPQGVSGLRAVAAFYGACGTDSTYPPSQAATNNLLGDTITPTMMFLGAIDTETPAGFCTRRADYLKGRGQPIDYKLYPETTHSFDEPNWGTQGRQIFHGTRGPFLYRYNPDATEDAWQTTRVFLDRHLKNPGQFELIRDPSG